MVKQLWDWTCAAVSALALVVVMAGGCRQPAAPAGGDELQELAALVEEGQQLAPVAHGVCDAFGLEEAQRCHGVVDAVDDLLAVGAPLVEGARVCREQGDQECLAASLETARRVGPELRRLLPLARLLAAGVR